MTTTQAEVMNTMMKNEEYELAEEVSLQSVDLSKPLQELFDECLNFISVNDFNV